MKRSHYALISIAALGVGIFATFQWEHADVQIRGLSLVRPGMTRNDALVLLGAPSRQKSTFMTDGIYGVPDHMENRIGFGNPFEMLSYEQAIPSKTVYATVWLCPDPSASGGEMRVVDVTTQVVKRSPRFVLLRWVAERFPGLGLDE
jgi:hypothetical protein